ncbi:MAG: hypothetical protein QNJ51_01755 [Calothrix sp. MO_167.B12]|nr:hypothetical protein [Calothrix sp. MO_167.B12]
MNGNTDKILGDCNMVLAISEDTINHQFKKLYHKKIIKDNFQLLVRVNKSDDKPPKPPTYTIKTQEGSDFQQTWNTWEEAQNHIAELFKQGQYEEFAKALAEEKKSGKLWDYGLDAQIDPPTITILKGEPKKLLFKITFKKGTLLYASDSIQPLDSYDLEGNVYAFNVPVGRLEINSKQEILTQEAKDQAEEVIQNLGLGISDFTMESLFLNFENANISDFDKDESHFNPSMTTHLQNVVEDYFKFLGKNKKDNPYILGYAVKVKKKDAPEALFQPTSLRFSTSHNDNPKLRAFNFLMMNDGKDFPESQDVGILPNSLLEKADMSVPALDGIFAIDYKLFIDVFIEKFIKDIEKTITEGFDTSSGFIEDNQKWYLSDTKSKTSSEGHQQINTKICSNITLTNNTPDSDGIKLKCTIEYSLNSKISNKNLRGSEVVDYQYWLSTNGNYAEGPDGKLGHPGIVEINIKPCTQGKMLIDLSPLEMPQLGYDRESYKKPDDISTQVVKTVAKSAVGNLFVVKVKNITQDMHEQIYKIQSVATNIINNLQNDINSINNNQIILPLGQLYTFKNIQLYTNNNVADNPVLFQVSYAPGTK